MDNPKAGDSSLQLAPVEALVRKRGVLVAQDVRYNQILVTGPPGSGKSTLVRRLGGWPEEGYIDLSMDGWWSARSLALRPREVHFGLPFVGRKAGLSLFGDEWAEAWRSLELDPARIRIPPVKRHLLSADWHNRFAFEFLLPPPDAIVRYRQDRARRGTHPIDERIDPDQIAAQIALYTRVALHFHRQGMIVHIRERLEDPPQRIEDHGATETHLP
ncbi:ATP-binding protein [Thiocystis violacea]|uniref:ATP-binding protein n=1 Tax=Thiocystis violacea TaxID=13725 RepID=UPI0019068F32|nr:ATP-binding protein [Thiocystis violacea]MBK1720789.1 serine/threonine protein phosphatase [Thiocystis violacea]